MNEQGMLHLHGLHVEVADFLGIELEDTDYSDFGVFPASVNRDVEDHKEAIYLISRVLADNNELNTSSLEQWVLPEEPEPEHVFGQVEFYKTDMYDRVTINDVELSIYRNGREHYKWSVLQELIEGMELGKSIERHYTEGYTERTRNKYMPLGEELLVGDKLPVEYRDDLESLIDHLKPDDERFGGETKVTYPMQ